ncbi:amidohydrolase [Anaerosphaera multitolerans]|uniref:Amidohydrolase n=2 Tax=Anaerosphaera multitolerans TaxID=2487351 RepID=A0A437S950_9FIRM|nr:amidohydrolase [Anaerosphaera multitolerans]
MEETIKNRRYLHANPELSKKEKNTSEFVMKKLDNLGINYKSKVGGYGVVGLIEGAYEGPTIMIRGDMDALPVEELTNLSFASKVHNVMHACGHDIHTANLIAVATALNEFKDEMHGNVKLCFQPAEEGSGGALSMINDGVLEDPKVDYAIGMHIEPSLKIGTASIETGPITSYPRFFKIKLIGNGGHGSVPYKSIDPIVAGVRLYEALNSITKEISPINPNVLQICAFNAGEAPAIIPDECEIMGTIRTHYKEDKELIKKRLYEMTETIAKLFNVQYEIDYWGISIPVLNDEKHTLLAANWVSDIFDKGLVQSETFKLAGEDFSRYSELVPSTFLVVGCSNDDPSTQYGLHNAKFNPDEKVLYYGMMALSTIALNYLEVKDF